MQMITDRLRGIREFFSGIGSYTLGKKYKLEVALYPDENTTEATCSHSIEGSSRQGLLKLCVLFAGAMLGIAMLCMIMRAIGSCFKK